VLPFPLPTGEGEGEGVRDVKNVRLPSDDKGTGAINVSLPLTQSPFQGLSSRHRLYRWLLTDTTSDDFAEEISFRSKEFEHLCFMVGENIERQLWETFHKCFCFRRKILLQINFAKPLIKLAQFRNLIFKTSSIGTHTMRSYFHRYVRQDFLCCSTTTTI